MKLLHNFVVCRGTCLPRSDCCKMGQMSSVCFRCFSQTIPFLSVHQGHTQDPITYTASLPLNPIQNHHPVFLFRFQTGPKETLYKLVPSDTLLNCTSCLTPHPKTSLRLWLTKHHPSISLHSLPFPFLLAYNEIWMIIHFQVQPLHRLCTGAPTTLLSYSPTF